MSPSKPLTEKSEKPGATAHNIDLFAGCPPAGCWRRDPRFAERQPLVWRVVGKAEDRGLLCGVAM